MLQNFFTKLSPKEKKIFYATLGFVVIALFDRLFLGPVTARLTSLDEEIKEEKNMINSDLRLLSFKEKVLKENMVFAPYFMVKARANEEIIAEFLKKIELLASETRVNLIRVTPSDSRRKKGFTEYFAVLECEGLLENIAKFMYAVDTSPDLMKIIKVNLTPQRAGGEEVGASMAIVKTIVDGSSLRDAEKVATEGTHHR